MRLLIAVLAVLVAGSAAQHRYYAQAPFTPIAPYRYSRERVVTQGRIATGFRDDDHDDYNGSPGVVIGSSTDPCRPSPCGPNTRCDTNGKGVALCRCIEGYVPDGNTINGCKPQCEVDEHCPGDHRCQRQECVRVCVQGACGLNADCEAYNHKAVCTCPDNFGGDPHISCRKEEVEERVLPPAPYRSPCTSSPCGLNAECRVHETEDRAVCSCPYGYEGNPLDKCIRGECIEHDDCPDYAVCQGLRCIDPCSQNVCGQNAECRTRNHKPVCSCPRGYVGDALTRCRPFDPRELCNPSPCGQNTNCVVKNDRAVCSCIKNYLGDPLTACRPECVSDGECRHKMACRNNICVNPCRDACGENAYCDVRNARAICSCPQHYKGDAHSRCYAECTQHDHCSDNKACINLQCADPCVNVCGSGANCKVENHRAICSCPRTHTGDPFRSCRPFTPADYCSPNPCGDNADCQPGTDRSGNDRAVCTCPRGFIGNPLISCQRGECEEHRECPNHLACYHYQCSNPCYTLEGESVCGEDAYCKVQKHMPVCYCADGYSGDPLRRCYIEHKSRGSGAYTLGRSK